MSEKHSWSERLSEPSDSSETSALASERQNNFDRVSDADRNLKHALA